MILTCGTEFAFRSSKLGQVDLNRDVVVLQGKVGWLVTLVVGPWNWKVKGHLILKLGVECKKRRHVKLP